MSTIIMRGRCSELDLPNFLVAVYRSVGLPARTVIGYESSGEDDGFLDNSKASKLRAWAEFCLFDENMDATRASVNWIPVDVVGLRKTSSRVPPLDKPWRGFGTFEDGDRIAPFAFQFHPPTTVKASGSPGFWGWLMTPRHPARAVQSLRFEVTPTARRAGDPAPGTAKKDGSTTTTTKKKKP
jgi:Transglutaminase-like superfamily